MNIINKIKLFLTDENGAETVEWVVVCAGIAAVAIAVYTATGNTSLTGAINLGINKIVEILN